MCFLYKYIFKIFSCSLKRLFINFLTDEIAQAWRNSQTTGSFFTIGYFLVHRLLRCCCVRQTRCRVSVHVARRRRQRRRAFDVRVVPFRERLVVGGTVPRFACPCWLMLREGRSKCFSFGRISHERLKAVNPLFQTISLFYFLSVVLLWSVFCCWQWSVVFFSQSN